MRKFTISPNKVLRQTTQGYYNFDYTSMSDPFNPKYLNILKNDRHDFNKDKLAEAVHRLIETLNSDLPEIVEDIGAKKLAICVVPRSKREKIYSNNQLLFKYAIQLAIEKYDNIVDGTEYIKRVADTRTTHLDSTGHGGAGSMPSRGISKDTCKFSDKIKGSSILLIDDIYTKTVNIDEDMIQALLDKGAKEVYFYAFGKTAYNDMYSKDFTEIIF